MLAQVGPSWPHVGSSWLKLASCWLKLAPIGFKLFPFCLKLASSWFKGQFWRQVGAAKFENSFINKWFSLFFKLLAVCLKRLRVASSWPQVASSWPQVGLQRAQVGVKCLKKSSLKSCASYYRRLERLKAPKKNEK